jgi:hypothetical protein
MDSSVTSRGIDFLEARTQVIHSIRRVIRRNDDILARESHNTSIFSSFSDEINPFIVLAIPAVCCVLLIIALACQPTTQYMTGLLVSLVVIVVVVVFNQHLYRLVYSAESNEIKRELELILHDYEKFSEHCAQFSSNGMIALSSSLI